MLTEIPTARVQQNTSAGEIKSLTSLRGVAALAVVTQHFSATAQLHSSGWIPSIVPHGYMAVDFFFVLSGFIMSYTYINSFQSLGVKAFPPFFLKRVARIFPLGLAVLLTVLLLGGFAAIWGRSDLFINQNAIKVGLVSSIIVNVLHLQGFSYRYNLNDPSWSISVEMAAYLIFPILIWIVFKGPRFISILFFFAGTLTLTSVAIAHPRLGLATRNVPFDLVRCFTEFSYGMLIYRIFQMQGPVRIIGADAGTWGITALSVAMLVLRLDLLAALSFPLVVLAWAWNTGSPSRVMSSRLPYFFGTISFSIYLVHHLFRRPELELLKHFFPDPIPPASALAFAFAGSISVIPVAALAYYFVEKPGRTAIKALIDRFRRRARGPTLTPDPQPVR